MKDGLITGEILPGSGRFGMTFLVVDTKFDPFDDFCD
jgi:hypothetical protein